MKISVVTVCYNSVGTIEETMLSVLNQTYPDVEYIIIDGGSTDGTVDIIKKYADRLAYWISETDNGIYDAMNKGIAVASGDYIYFIGSDDTLLDNNVFSSVYQFYENTCSDVIYGDVILQPSGQLYSGIFSKWKLIRKNICHQAIFYPLSLLRRYPYGLKYRAYSDYYENLLLWSKNVKFKYIPVTIANFSVGGFSINGDSEFMKNRRRLILNFFGIIGYIYYLLRVSLVQRLKRYGHI